MVIPVIIETADILVVDKPAGALSVPSRWGEKDPRPCVQIELSKARSEQLWPVHRLDEEVSGILVFARTPLSHRKLSMAFESREAHKTYEAWTAAADGVEVPSPGTSFRWDNLVVRGKKRTFEAPHGKQAITDAVFVNAKIFRGHAATVPVPVQAWELHPLTGRSHQLRFHLAKAGFPCLGDALYGSKTEFFPDAIALRHVRLEIPGHAPWVATGLEAWVQKTITP